MVAGPEPRGNLDFRVRILGFCQKSRAFRVVLRCKPRGKLDFCRWAAGVSSRRAAGASIEMPPRVHISASARKPFTAAQCASGERLL